MEELYMDKLLYLPNKFFSEGHAMQRGKVKRPITKYVVVGLEQYDLSDKRGQVLRMDNGKFGYQHILAYCGEGGADQYVPGR